VAKAPTGGALDAFLAANFSYRCQEAAVSSPIVSERASYRPTAVLKHFSADQIPENSHGSVLHRARAKLIRVTLALDVLYDLGRAPNPVALRVNNLERLADVQLGNLLQGEIIQLVKHAMQIEPGECLGPHFARASHQCPPD
jgi:hypothetical protein